MTIKSNISYDQEKARAAVQLLKEYFKENMTYANVSYPQSIIYGSSEYFIYIFYSCLLDYGMKSKLYHDNLIKTYYNYPNIFNPSYVILHQNELDYILRNSIRVRYPGIALKKWIKLSEFLMNETDLKKRLNDFESYKDMSLFIDSTQSFGQKTGGLLKRLITECLGKYVVEDIPIDRHDIEISYLISVVSSIELKGKDIKKLSNIWVLASKTQNVNPSLVDQYLWTIGVEMCTNKRCFNCPLKDICKYKDKEE